MEAEFVSLKERFEKEIHKKLKEELNIKNDLRVPRPVVGYVQIGIGKLITQHPESKERILEEGSYALSMITGQKPKIIVARKSIAGFKLKKGQPVSLLVTLRKKRLFDFIDRLLTYALPRAKDFRGIRKNHLDNKGNLNIGLKEISIFPEAVSEKVKINFGCGITIVGSGRTKEENIKLWEALGFPLRL